MRLQGKAQEAPRTKVRKRRRNAALRPQAMLDVFQ
jgi:hypothetical protein